MVQIKGLQKTTLVDYPGKVACTVFLPGCNFRCGYCHNADLVCSAAALPTIPEKEFFAFLASRKGKVEGVCITGGEPTITKGLPEFCKRVKDAGFLVKLDSNGTNPSVLRRLIEEKLVDYIAMDVKAPIEQYSIVSCVDTDTGKLAESIGLIRESGIDYEFRATVIPDVFTDETVKAIGKAVCGAKRFFFQQFQPSKKAMGERYRDMEPLPAEALESFGRVMRQFVGEVGIRK
ncbi:TPA: anaerobic ribonucleoside-triphosphate reductase activating protein [Candidatus Woesearchaeota archaeon]|nr:anaerobic ribonucleoside-triphosphate reductase activating protein [Candidatus Woesearchaeota archaeon]HII68260.1 anaerobic ribonucleoside-triphosphate reductase activating protein [Candidatus Woesearchaeota archaeon]